MRVSLPACQLNKRINQSHLYAKVSSIDIVSQEQILGVGWWATDFEKFHKVVELTMNVSAYCSEKGGNTVS